MDLKKATTEYEVQMRDATRAHQKCQDMARNEEAIEAKIKKYTREVEERMARIRDLQAELAASKERHRIALEELQKTVPLASMSFSQIKVKQEHEQQACAPPSSQVEASSTRSTRGRKRDILAVAPDSPPTEERRFVFGVMS